MPEFLFLVSLEGKCIRFFWFQEFFCKFRHVLFSAKSTKNSPTDASPALGVLTLETGAYSRVCKQTGPVSRAFSPPSADGSGIKSESLLSCFSVFLPHSENSGQQDFASQAHAGVDVHTGPTLTETVAMQGANSAGEYAAQVDIADVVRQIVTYTRVNYTANQETTMEMQLNPEHLGKIYLEITSKDGTVSAHLTAQNEVVKEALESQIADLKQNMNQAGVKVDAVEVTVGGHEFEKNLEQNAKQEEQQAEEREKAANATRHINLNELDGLSGLMTEEETLVAKMMAEQGNSVDFTA